MRTDIVKKNYSITTLEDWKRYAGPKKASQWAVGRSAMESARRWIDSAPDVPEEISQLLLSHSDFSALLTSQAEPEAQVRFDRFSGEPANLDVLLSGEDDRGPVVVAIEAKADEPFSTPLADTLKNAQVRLANNDRSKGVARIEQLLQAVIGVDLNGAEPYLDLRYQLLTATAAALAEAERRSARRAAIVVHEFITDKTNDEKHQNNAADFIRFLTAIAPDIPPPATGSLIGPVKLPGNPLIHADIAMYFGKTSINLRST